MQSIWKGTISFGLVSIPVRLFAATEERSVALHQVHAEDGGRIRYRRVCSLDGTEVAYADIARGYELPDGEVVVLTDEDFASLPLSSSRTIEVDSFVPMDQIEPIQLSRSYYCDPTADTKPYVLLREALARTGRVALVKVALRQREALAVLRPREGVLVLQTMLWPDEVREARFRFLEADVPVRPQELAMAESYVEALAGDFTPEAYQDRYRQALEELIAAKTAGRQVSRPVERAEEGGAVVDLMEALRRSVAAAQRERGGTAKPPAAKAAPKQA
ncbi:MAG: Ku protein, partial [Actinomycetota bacterium]